MCLRSAHFNAIQPFTRLMLVLLLIITLAFPGVPVSRHLTQPAQATDTVQSTPTVVTSWAADFQHLGLGRRGTLVANAQTCVMQLSGSKPNEIVMHLMVDRAPANAYRLQVYAGWPRNDQGQITGVSNCSSDPPRTRLIEQKLGPTIVWAMSGCRTVCVTGVILQSIITITHGSETHVVNQITQPALDSWSKSNPCLAPAFSALSADGTLRYAGAIDQPGPAISAIGDSCRDINGQPLIVAGDHSLAVVFKHRAYLECDDEVVAITDWGYVLRAQLGRPACEIEPHIIEDVVPTVLTRDEADPDRRADFDAALLMLRSLLSEVDK